MPSTKTDAAAQVYEVYIKAPAQTIWDAITKPEWRVKYAYRGSNNHEMRPGGAYRDLATPQMREFFGMPEVVIDGQVIEVDPPRKFVHTYRFLFSEELKAEGFTRVTWEIEKVSANFCRLTVTHELEGAPLMAAMVTSKFSEQGTGGWTWLLSDLKSLLETGTTLGG